MTADICDIRVVMLRNRVARYEWRFVAETQRFDGSGAVRESGSFWSGCGKPYPGKPVRHILTQFLAYLHQDGWELAPGVEEDKTRWWVRRLYRTAQPQTVTW